MPLQRSITPQSQHVLANLERVVGKPYKVEVNSPRRRSQLDGIECTPQITSLVVRGFVIEDDDGNLTRTAHGNSMRQNPIVSAEGWKVNCSSDLSPTEVVSLIEARDANVVRASHSADQKRLFRLGFLRMNGALMSITKSGKIRLANERTKPGFKF